MPESWRKSDLISIYKSRCYRSVKLSEYGMKVIERIFEKRQRNVVRIDKMQMGFMPGRRTTDAIFILRQMLEKYEMARRKLYVVFVDLEKAFGRILREVNWSAARKKCLIEKEENLYFTRNTIQQRRFRGRVEVEFLAIRRFFFQMQT